MKITIGIMGSAFEKSGSTKISPKVRKETIELGKQIAKHNCILVNGACGGMPELAAQGAKKQKGFVIGISPAETFQEHIKKYKLPYKSLNTIIYTGMGFKGRDITNIINSDAIIISQGASGTLNEFSLAYDSGKIIGILCGSGGVADVICIGCGITDRMSALERMMKRKKTGAVIIKEDDPKKLVQRVLKEIIKRKKANKEYTLLSKEEKPKMFKQK